MSLHDVETGLPGRELALDRLTVACARCTRTGTAVALMLVDAGDDLPGVARRLREIIRAGDTVARIDRSELVVIGDDLRDAAAAETLAERVLSLLAPVPVTIALVVVDGVPGDAASLLQEARRSLDELRARGGTYTGIDAEVRERAAERARAEAELHQAIAAGELVLEYQPVVDIEDGMMRGVEALVRWEHPDEGRLPPGRFVPTAAESDAIVALGDWVLRDASRQMASWHARHPDAAPPWLAVNVAVRQLEHPAIVERVERALDESGLAAEMLRVEIAEAELAAGSPEAATALRRLRAVGVGVAIDDATPRWRSVAGDVWVDVVKVGPEHAAAVLDARWGAVEVVVQRIEDREQETIVREHGGHLAQGFLYARPAPAAELEGLFVLPPAEPVES